MLMLQIMFQIILKEKINKLHNIINHTINAIKALKSEDIKQNKN